MNDTYSVFYSDEATNDLRNIFMYIAYNLQARDTAEAQVNRIRTSIRKLEKNPKLNPLVQREPWTSIGMRRLNVDNYAVLYLTDEDSKRVEIVRIPHSTMDLDRLFDDEIV